MNKFITKLALFLIFLIVFIGCEKEPITPGNYHTVQSNRDTINWQNQYGNNGTVPTWDNNNTTGNQINGTNWVLIDVYNNYAHISKSDTIHFISNENYTIGLDTTKYIYHLYNTTGNSSITFNNFIPINGLTLSCTNFNANAFKSCPIGGTIFLALKDNFTITNNLYTSTFKKI